jgi:cytochrome c oxidase subunit 2
MAIGKEQAARIPRRVLIVSSHPLFGKGLEKLLQERLTPDSSIVGIVSTVEDAVRALDTSNPDLVIVDYDDERVNRDEFLARFVESARQLRVVLLSLKEGGSEAIVYDRRTMAAAQIDDWLDEWSTSDRSKPRKNARTRFLKKTGPRSSNMKHFIAVAVVIAALFGLLFLGLQSVRLLPVAASAQAGPIDGLFRLHFILIIFLFSLIVGLMVYSLVVFRRKKDDLTDGPHMEGNTTLEIAWTIIPLLVVLAVSFIGSRVLAQVNQADPKPLHVNVYAQQWSWRFEYPEDGISSDTLYLPVDRQVVLRMISADVIHSFWVPEFRVKQDVLPGGEGMVRELRINPNLIGDYKVRCAEVCGTRHAFMEQDVKVVSESDFNAWLEESSVASDDPVVRGQQTAQSVGCMACHSIDGTTVVGPTWKGLYMSQVPLEDGSTVTADDAYLLESIKEPQTKIHQGLPNVMPRLADNMTDEQIQDIIAFIKSLK